MSGPEEHPVLDWLFEKIEGDLSRNTDAHRDFRLESECIEFYDDAEEQWYEIVVRAIDEPSSEGVFADDPSGEEE